MSIIIKTPEQIAGIRKSCQLAAECLRFIEPYVQEGMQTGELDHLLHDFIIKNNATPASLNYHGFPKSVCISVNEVICHGIPGEYCLKEGDILNIDVTTILDGYFGDTSRMYTVGEVSAEAEKLIRVTKECLDIGIKQVREGNYFGNIGYWIAQHAKKHGYSVCIDYCGHGCGLSFHESPRILHDDKRYTGDIMRNGYIFTIEPMINQGVRDVVILEDGWTAATKDRKLSAQEEHTVLVKDMEAEILTLWNK